MENKELTKVIKMYDKASQNTREKILKSFKEDTTDNIVIKYFLENYLTLTNEVKFKLGKQKALIDRANKVAKSYKPIKPKLDSIDKRILEYKKRCISKDREFSLTKERFTELLHNNCVYCGDSTPICIDRIDSSIGYIEGNVVSACYTCNMMKNTLSKDKFFEKIKQLYLYNH
jgi:hypothetical protein